MASMVHESLMNGSEINKFANCFTTVQPFLSTYLNAHSFIFNLSIAPNIELK